MDITKKPFSNVIKLLWTSGRLHIHKEKFFTNVFNILITFRKSLFDFIFTKKKHHLTTKNFPEHSHKILAGSVRSLRRLQFCRNGLHQRSSLTHSPASCPSRFHNRRQPQNGHLLVLWSRRFVQLLSRHCIYWSSLETRHCSAVIGGQLAGDLEPDCWGLPAGTEPFCGRSARFHVQIHVEAEVSWSEFSGIATAVFEYVLTISVISSF